MERRKNSGRRAEELEQQRLLHELEVHKVELQVQNDELIRARAEVEVALERYTELFEFAPVGYLILTRQGVIQELNLAGAQALGEERSRLLNEPLRKRLGQPDVLDRLIQLVVSSEHEQRDEVEILWRGDTRRCRITATLFARGEGLILLALEDITDLVRTEMALREAAQRKDEFLAMLSHELRNPLAPIRLSLAVLSHPSAAGEQVSKARQIIERQVTHMTRLVDDLLDVNRIAQGKINLDRHPVELGSLVRSTLEDYRPSFDESGIQLNHALDGGAFELEADATRLVQALSNLLRNAEKFTPRGGSVTVELRRQDSHAVLTVRDTGVGIAPELLQRVFEPFVQASQDRSRGGLGLGLAMVKGIVELHGGRVSVASDGANRGACITLHLPLRAAPTQEVLYVRDVVTSERRRVLVIDDNLDNADSMGDVLRLAGHDVQVAYEGRTGVELARTFHPDVVLCDLGLPDVDGYAVAHALRADASCRDVYLVAVSGYRRQEDVERARHAGFDEHLAKPARLEEVARLIAQAHVHPFHRQEEHS